MFFFFQAEDGIRDAQESRGLGDVYKRQADGGSNNGGGQQATGGAGKKSRGVDLTSAGGGTALITPSSMRYGFYTRSALRHMAMEMITTSIAGNANRQTLWWSQTVREQQSATEEATIEAAMGCIRGVNTSCMEIDPAFKNPFGSTSSKTSSDLEDDADDSINNNNNNNSIITPFESHTSPDGKRESSGASSLLSSNAMSVVTPPLRGMGGVGDRRAPTEHLLRLIVAACKEIERHVMSLMPVSYTHLTLPTKRIV
eukprot:TRINITY_DN10716_c0_g1_i2.p1 TRINITY_DN10716_c0_g1~~TRINITY_DN10716_c0_g1_i2.p1  ORF type:complete len:256 (+),score=58.89 TRINITY_DN10716_c0_g1_i2:52-819(+)